MTKILLSGPRKLHEKMVSKVIRAKKEFFDRNPSGRILNRFSSDIGTIDMTLINNTFTLFDGSVRALLTLIIISTLSYYLIIVCLLISYAFFKAGLYFKLPISRIKQLESVSRSPLYSDLSQTLSGLITIRCYH